MYYTTAKQMEKLDKLVVQNGLEIRQMMELAGLRMVELFNTVKIKKGSHIAIFVGKGNKGGDGLSAARHLANHGWKHITIIMLSESISKDSRHHLQLIEKMKIPVLYFSEVRSKVSKLLERSDIIIDSLIGYHLFGAPRGIFAQAIQEINNAENKVIAYDLPSGAEATTGECFDPCIKANYTLTLALPKKVFNTQSGKKYSGRVFLADIGIPEFLYKKIKATIPPWNGRGIIRV
jgi:NAD(P)H-hydrate epimerase